ncbi:MAG: M15 family metallopeptidase [bacterium]
MAEKTSLVIKNTTITHNQSKINSYNQKRHKSSQKITNKVKTKFVHIKRKIFIRFGKYKFLLYIILFIIIILMITFAFPMKFFTSDNKVESQTNIDDIQKVQLENDKKNDILNVTDTPIHTTLPTIIPTTTSDTVLEKIKSLDKMIFFPVDKKTQLESNFVPNNLESLTAKGITASSENDRMRKEIIADLKNMFDDAKKNGVLLRVLSPYRSYTYQDTLFNMYVQEAKARGLTEEQAIVEANKSSAKPGFSEHQLGTACDVVSSEDYTLDYTNSNKQAWEWLKNNMEKYGFVLSYPEGKDEITGYIFEPWHIRWVSLEVAQDIKNTDYKNIDNGNTTTGYLKQVWEKIK